MSPGGVDFFGMLVLVLVLVWVHLWVQVLGVAERVCVCMDIKVGPDVLWMDVIDYVWLKVVDGYRYKYKCECGCSCGCVCSLWL